MGGTELFAELGLWGDAELGPPREPWDTGAVLLLDGDASAPQVPPLAGSRAFVRHAEQLLRGVFAA